MPKMQIRKGKRMLLYMLTDENDKTRECCWGESITHDVPDSNDLHTSYWIYAYIDPLLAVMMNPICDRYDLSKAHLWQCEGEIGIYYGTRVGCTELTTIEHIPVPKVTITQRITFAILVSLKVYDELNYVNWAKRWLSGEDRGVEAAQAMAGAASSGRSWTSNVGAAGAAVRSAAWEERSAVWSARAVAWAARAVREEAEAKWTAWTNQKLDLATLAQKALVGC